MAEPEKHPTPRPRVPQLGRTVCASPGLVQQSNVLSLKAFPGRLASRSHRWFWAFTGVGVLAVPAGD